MRSVNTKHIFMILLLLFFLYLDGTCKYAQGAEKRGDTERLGSADKLSGNVYSLTIFISTPQSRWKSKDKLKMFQQQKEAEDWLVSQAWKYGVKLAFQNGAFGLDQDISVVNIPSFDGRSGNYKFWSRDLLNLVGYKTPLDFWSWVLKNTNCTNLHIIVYANITGKSYSLPFRQGLDATTFFVEGSMLYRYQQPNGGINPAMISHEVLHVYDAWDLYNSTNAEAEARKLFPNDIMYRNSYNLNELQVGSLTAWRIGWSNKKEPWYERFKPVHKSTAKHNSYMKVRPCSRLGPSLD